MKDHGNAVAKKSVELSADAEHSNGFVIGDKRGRRRRTHKVSGCGNAGRNAPKNLRCRHTAHPRSSTSFPHRLRRGPTDAGLRVGTPTRWIIDVQSRNALPRGLLLLAFCVLAGGWVLRLGPRSDIPSDVILYACVLLDGTNAGQLAKFAGSRARSSFRCRSAGSATRRASSSSASLSPPWLAAHGA